MPVVAAHDVMNAPPPSNAVVMPSTRQYSLRCTKYQSSMLGASTSTEDS